MSVNYVVQTGIVHVFGLWCLPNHHHNIMVFLYTILLILWYCQNRWFCYISSFILPSSLPTWLLLWLGFFFKSKNPLGPIFEANIPNGTSSTYQGSLRKRAWICFPQEPSTINSFPNNCGCSWNSLTFHNKMLTGLILYKCCAISQTYCELS